MDFQWIFGFLPPTWTSPGGGDRGPRRPAGPPTELAGRRRKPVAAPFPFRGVPPSRSPPGRERMDVHSFPSRRRPGRGDPPKRKRGGDRFSAPAGEFRGGPRRPARAPVAAAGGGPSRGQKAKNPLEIHPERTPISGKSRCAALSRGRACGLCCQKRREAPLLELPFFGGAERRRFCF